MYRYNAEPLLLKANAVGKEIHELTEGFMRKNNGILFFLQKRAEELPQTIAIAVGKTTTTQTAYEDLLRIAYKQAHDAEFLLFLSLILYYLPSVRASALIHKVHEVKRMVVAAIKNTRAEA